MSIDLFQSPERLLFGWGSVGKTGEEALRYGAKALLVSGTNIWPRSSISSAT